MRKIENAKTYTGRELETVFFRPMLVGEQAEKLGINVMYNIPVPTTLHFWKHSGDILQKFTSGGWNGTVPAERLQKTLELSRVKAEAAYSADDYYSLIYSNLASRPDSTPEDFSGTELEEAETALFREALAESIRMTMWIGDTSVNRAYNTFDGLIPKILKANEEDEDLARGILCCATKSSEILTDLRAVWDNAPEELKAMKSQGNLVWFVTNDVYQRYEDYLETGTGDDAVLARQYGKDGLFYKGIPMVNINIGQQDAYKDIPSSFILLTDPRNLTLAVNTKDFPGTEVRMWYNPDVMENRQRATFMAGCDFLMPELLSMGFAFPEP